MHASCSTCSMTDTADPIPSELEALHAALLTKRAARQEAEARASGLDAMVAHLKLLIAKLRQERFGASAERGAWLDQLELHFEELEAAASEHRATAFRSSDSDRPEAVHPRPARRPLPARLPRERVVIPAGPTACPCRQGQLTKLRKDVTETLEMLPSSWKVVQTVRERLVCRACETITQVPAPFHLISRGRAGPELLATILEAKFGRHLLLNRQSETFALEEINLDVSTLVNWVGACSTALAPLIELIRAHALAAERLHGDDTTVPALARHRTSIGRLWTYVRNDRPFGGSSPPAAMFHHTPDRTAAHPPRHLSRYTGILQADAYAGFNELYRGARAWAHRRGGVLGAGQAQAVRPRRFGRRRLRARQCGGSTRFSTPSAASSDKLPSSAWRCGKR